VDSVLPLAGRGGSDHRVQNDEREWEAKCEEAKWRRENGLDIDFVLPGSDSALRAATPDNPRNRPCPNCNAPNRLTPDDRALGHQCDTCADKAERGCE
jgi:hypothetical protein